MPLLFHWRGDNYRVDMQNRSADAYNLNQNSPTMLNAKPGDTIWAFTRREDKVYVLAVKGIIKKLSKYYGSSYGAHRVWLDPTQTVYFDVDEGLNVEPVIRSLSIRAEAEVLGLSFQGHAGVREITKADNQKLEEFAEKLRRIKKKVRALPPRISQLPESIPVMAGTVSSSLSRMIDDETDQDFNPKDEKDARERIAATIARRRGQPRFRRILLSAYEGKCAITGSDVKEVLEAAHIVPYRGDHTNKLANGLLLRADIHTLFDLGLIAVDTTTMTIIIAPTLANTEYEILKGSGLMAKPVVMRKIKSALDAHRYTHFGNSKQKK